MQYLVCLDFKTEGAEICICAFGTPHTWHAWLTVAWDHLTAVPYDFCNENCHVYMLNCEKWAAFSVEMKVYYGMLPSSSCRMCTKTCQRDLDQKREEEGKPRTKHSSPGDAQVLSHHTDGLMSQLVSLSQALAQHIQESFQVLAAKRGDWCCATYRKIHCGWKEGGGVIKSKMIQIWSWYWHQNKWEKLRSDPDSLKCPGGLRGWNLGCFHQKQGWGSPASWQVSKMQKQGQACGMSIALSTVRLSLEDHKQHKALMDMLGCADAELTPGPSHWLPWSVARIRTSQLPLLHPRYPKQRGSALPQTQGLAVQANHTPKCPQPWAIPFPP